MCINVLTPSVSIVIPDVSENEFCDGPNKVFVVDRSSEIINTYFTYVVYKDLEWRPLKLTVYLFVWSTSPFPLVGLEVRIPESP